MGTTTIRVDTDTHERLVTLSRASGRTLLETVRDATEALRRQRFARQAADELAALRADPAAWDDYLGDAETRSTADGVD